MIGKITVGKSFGGCIAYCLNDKIRPQNHEYIKDRAEVLMYNKCFGNEKELVQQFNEVRQLNSKLAKPVLHITLSLSPGENLSKDKLMEMCEHCAKDLGFQNNQYIAIAHRDTNHQHLHLVANRIGFDKRTVSNSNDYQKMANYCRKMELRYQLKQVLSPKRYLSKEQRNIPRHDQRKELLKQHLKEALLGCSNLQQLEVRMKERGYKVIKGRGISFADEKKVIIKGSEVNYSLQTVEKILAKQQSVQYIEHQNQSTPVLEKESSKATELSQVNNNKGFSKAMEVLITAEEMDEGIDKNLRQKRNKKKRQSHH